MKMTIYKVGRKIDGWAADIEYIYAESEESAAILYDKLYRGIGYSTEFYVKKLGLFRITVHVVRIKTSETTVTYRILRKSWRPLSWFDNVN